MMNKEQLEVFGAPADSLSDYGPWDQAMAGLIVGHLMLHGLLMVEQRTDEGNVTRAMCIVARCLGAITPTARDEWPVEP